jgi:hypothetical protein
MERKGTIVLVERTGRGGTTSLGTATRFDERQTLPVVPFTGDHDLLKPAPKVAYAEVEGFPLWEGEQGIEFQDPYIAHQDHLRRGRLRIYLCPKQDRVNRYAERLGLSIYHGGLAGDHQISMNEVSWDNTVTNFPNLFQNDNRH